MAGGSGEKVLPMTYQHGTVTNKPVFDTASVLASAKKNYMDLMNTMEMAYDLAISDQERLYSHCKEWEDKIDELIHNLNQNIRDLAATKVEYTDREIHKLMDLGYDPEPYYNEEIMEFISWLPTKPNLCYPTENEINKLRDDIENVKNLFYRLLDTVEEVWGVS